MCKCNGTKKPADTKGMPPLQAALATGWHKEIAWYLLEHGADVNYIEGKEWKQPQTDPAFFDAAQAAIYNARRYERDKETEEYKLVHSKEDADEAFEFLKAVIEHGADLKKTDYYNNGVISRVLFAANDVYPHPRYPGRRRSAEQDEDLLRIFNYLIEQGAEKETISLFAKKSTSEIYKDEPIWELFGQFYQ